MNKPRVLALLVVFLVTSCLNDSTHAKNEQQVDIRLEEFRVDKCLYDFLSSVVLSNRQFYQSTDYYYSFEFGLTADRRSLYIAPEKWKSARTLDYIGYVAVNGVLFLCKGSLSKDSLFHKTGKIKYADLILSKNELGRMQTLSEPSLEGTLKLCPGMQLDVSVYTKGKIKGYLLKE